MAKGDNAGDKLAFNLNDKQIAKLIDEYKQEYRAGVFPRPSWSHWCAYLGFSEDEVKQVFERGQSRQSVYYERSVLLKRMATWIRGEMISGSSWSGQMQSKAIFALKQDVGDGYFYSDQPQTTGQPSAIKIEFGGGDKRAHKAAK